MPFYEYKCKRCKKTLTRRMTVSQYEKQKDIKCSCGGVMKPTIHTHSFYITGEGVHHKGWS